METTNDVLAKAQKRADMYKRELKKEIRSFATYFDQIGNIVMGLIRLSGWWVLLTTISTAACVLLSFIFIDLSQFSYGENQEGFRMITKACGIFSALACILSNVGRFQNIFDMKAQSYVDHYKQFEEKFEFQISNIDSLLLAYGLIKQEDIEKRKAKALTSK